MLDVGRQEVSLREKRLDLVSKIAEGRGVIATLVERHAAMGHKIEEATAGLRRLEEQLAAMNTVMKVFDGEGLIMTAEQAIAPAPVMAEPQEAEPVRFAPRREPFKPITYLHCLGAGHTLRPSRSTPGHLTCTRCRIRRKSGRRS